MIKDSVTIILPTYKEVDSLPTLIDGIEQVKQESIEHLTPVSYTHLTLPTIYSV